MSNKLYARKRYEVILFLYLDEEKLEMTVCLFFKARKKQTNGTEPLFS
jgi:hypothetical protein